MNLSIYPKFNTLNRSALNRTTPKPKIHSLFNNDTITFSSNLYDTKFEETLYRTISKKELDSLLAGNSSGCMRFVTTEPMGWGATNWSDGFRHDIDNIYFIKFKPNHFKTRHVLECDYAIHDKTYMLSENYSLDDIESIHQGHNIKGKIIWSSL